MNDKHMLPGYTVAHRLSLSVPYENSWIMMRTTIRQRRPQTIDQLSLDLIQESVGNKEVSLMIGQNSS